MNIHYKLRTIVPFSSIKQGDLFWVQGPAGGLFIKLGKTDSSTEHYPFNSYKVGEKKGGRNFCDEALVTPVNDVTIS